MAYGDFDDLPYLETHRLEGTTPYDRSPSPGCGLDLPDLQPALGVARLRLALREHLAEAAYRLTPGVRATVVASRDKAYGESDDLLYLETHRLEVEPRPTTYQVLRGT